MKVVLFCGGFGTRIREYSESIPKPMVPVGLHPIVWHVMQYYMHYGHREFVLCLGHKANVIKDYFLTYRPTTDRDFVISEHGTKIDVLGDPERDWKVTLVDTGIWRNVGQRLKAVRNFLCDDDIFLANYSDGLTDAPLDKMIEFFESKGKIACFLAVQPSFTYHLVDFDDAGLVKRFRTSQQSRMWVNGGFFIFRRAIFDYIREGEELVDEPFARLMAEDQLIAYRHHGFWASMDTLKDKMTLEDMMERGHTPWLPWLRENGE
jgi:glucose-1-phosphate cytidylyltransferase